MHRSFSRRVYLQNAIIVLLLGSAIGLFVQSQVFHLGESPATYLEQMLSLDTAYNWEENQESTGLIAPVAVAVTGSFGRYGSPNVTTQDVEFSLIAPLLSQALSAMPATAMMATETEFLVAVDDTSIYVDFQVALPCNVVGAMVGLGEGYNQTVMRRVVLSPDSDGGVSLYWWDGDETYGKTDTEVSLEDFYALLEDYQADNVFFAFEGQSLSDQLATVDAFSLFETVTDTYYTLGVSNPTLDKTTLLAELGFNPYTNSRYVESNGTEVVFQEEDRVQFTADGVVIYESTGQVQQAAMAAVNAYSTAQEVVSSASAFLNTLLGTLGGDGTLYVSAYSQNDTQTVVEFGYHVDGLPVVQADGEAAAVMTLENGILTGLRLNVRRYTLTDAEVLLLPVTQAAALAQKDAILHLAYVSYDTDSASVMWLG